MKSILYLFVFFVFCYKLSSNETSGIFENFNVIRIANQNPSEFIKGDILIVNIPTDYDIKEFYRLKYFKINQTSLDPIKCYFIDSLNFWTIYNFLRCGEYPYYTLRNQFKSDDKGLSIRLENKFNCEVEFYDHNKFLKNNTISINGFSKYLDFQDQIILSYLKNKLKADTLYSTFKKELYDYKKSALKALIFEFLDKSHENQILNDTSLLTRDFIKIISNDKKYFEYFSQLRRNADEYKNIEIDVIESSKVDDDGRLLLGFYKTIRIIPAQSQSNFIFNIIYENDKWKISNIEYRIYILKFKITDHVFSIPTAIIYNNKL